MENRPECGEWYRDSQERLYQVVTTAIFSETQEELVVYQALYGSYQVYAGPIGMFLSGEDRAKYPQAAQKYRFERVQRPEGVGQLSDGESGIAQKEAGEAASGDGAATALQDGNGREERKAFRERKAREENEAEGVSPKLMAFFDADDLEEKYHILLSMREEITDHLINNMAVVLDVVIPEGDLDSRYEELKRCIRTRQRYESDRLR